MSGIETVSIDTTRCQGHGRCYELAPAVFTDDDRGYGSVANALVPSDQHDAVEAAARACPELAVLIQRVVLTTS